MLSSLFSSGTATGAGVAYNLAFLGNGGSRVDLPPLVVILHTCLGLVAIGKAADNFAICDGNVEHLSRTSFDFLISCP